MSNLITYYHFKLDLQKMGQHIYPSRECKHDIKESEGNIFNIQWECPGVETSRVVHLQNPNNLVR